MGELHRLTHELRDCDQSNYGDPFDPLPALMRGIADCYIQFAQVYVTSAYSCAVIS